MRDRLFNNESECVNLRHLRHVELKYQKLFKRQSQISGTEGPAQIVDPESSDSSSDDQEVKRIPRESIIGQVFSLEVEEKVTRDPFR